MPARDPGHTLYTVAMNLSLHFGLLGSLEAAGIALLIGLLVHVMVHYLTRPLRWAVGHTLAWSFGVSVVIGAGIDIWKLFYMGIVRMESPFYARLFLSTVHDPNELGSRVVLEIIGALCGVALGWLLFSARSAAENEEKR